MTAVASISTLALSSIKLLTSTTDMAGKCRPTSFRYIFPRDFKESKYSCLSVMNQVNFVICSALALASAQYAHDVAQSLTCLFCKIITLEGTCFIPANLSGDKNLFAFSDNTLRIASREFPSLRKKKIIFFIFKISFLMANVLTIKTIKKYKISIT